MTTYYVQKPESNATHYKKKHLEFDYIKANDFKEIERNTNPNILGIIKLTTPVENCNADKVIIESNNQTYTYKLHYQNCISCNCLVGYLKVDDNTYIAILKQSILIPILLTFSGMAILIGLLYTCINPPQPISNTSSLEFEQGSDWDGNMPQNGKQSKANTDSIEIPGYANLYVSSENPNIQLINPTGNTVYFVYTLLENDTTIYESKAIEPDKMINVNLKELLPIGTHTISFKISTYDVETQAACNGATQEVTITVNE